MIAINLDRGAFMFKREALVARSKPGGFVISQI
jgi:hypothetical protein